MNDHDAQRNTQQGSSKTGVGIGTSPFNAVKLELGFIIVFGIILWLSVDFITSSVGIQLMMLSRYGLLCALWLIVRTRRILKHQNTEND